MRGANGSMNVITRAEFDDAMQNFATKDDLSAIVSSVKETLKENLGDLRVDLFAQIEEKITRSHNILQVKTVDTNQLNEAKCEILATTRRNIADATAPLATTAEMAKVFDGIAKGIDGVAKGFGAVEKGFDGIDKRFDGVEKRFDGVALEFLKMESRLDAMEHKINTVVMDGFSSLREMISGLTTEMRDVVKKQEDMLDRHDADLYKLRQSGVLQ
jgi:hypothetical protein